MSILDMQPAKKDGLLAVRGPNYTLTSGIIRILEKLQFFSKIGTIVWPIVAIACTSGMLWQNLKIPTNMVEIMFQLMVAFYVLIILSVPLSVYLLREGSPGLFRRNDLRPPRYILALVLPYVLRTVIEIVQMIMTYQMISVKSPGQVFFWFVNHAGKVLTSSIYNAIPSFMFGTMASNFTSLLPPSSITDDRGQLNVKECEEVIARTKYAIQE